MTDVQPKHAMIGAVVGERDPKVDPPLCPLMTTAVVTGLAPPRLAGGPSRVVAHVIPVFCVGDDCALWDDQGKWCSLRAAPAGLERTKAIVGVAPIEPILKLSQSGVVEGVGSVDQVHELSASGEVAADGVAKIFTSSDCLPSGARKIVTSIRVIVTPVTTVEANEEDYVRVGLFLGESVNNRGANWDRAGTSFRVWVEGASSLDCMLKAGPETSSKRRKSPIDPENPLADFVHGVAIQAHQFFLVLVRCPDAWKGATVQVVLGGPFSREQAG